MLNVSGKVRHLFTNITCMTLLSVTLLQPGISPAVFVGTAQGNIIIIFFSTHHSHWQLGTRRPSNAGDLHPTSNHLENRSVGVIVFSS